MREEKIIKMTMVHYHWIYDQFNANGTFLGHWIKLFISFGGSSSDLNIHWTSNKNVASSSGVRTVFGYHRKSLILHCELHLIEWTEVHYKCQNAQFSEFSKAYSLRSNSVTRQVNFNGTKIGGKLKNLNVTFWVLFDFVDAFKSRFLGGIFISLALIRCIRLIF